MGEMSMFSGLMYCSDCGQKMYLRRSREDSKQAEHFNCLTYRKKKKKTCTSHYISVDVIEKIVKADIQRICSFAKGNESGFLKLLTSYSDSETSKLQAIKSRELEESENRIKTLDKIIQLLYEDKVNNKISEERFNKLSTNYEAEQGDLENRAAMLKKELVAVKNQEENTAKFLHIIHKYTDIPELTAEICESLLTK